MSSKWTCSQCGYLNDLEAELAKLDKMDEVFVMNVSEFSITTSSGLGSSEFLKRTWLIDKAKEDRCFKCDAKKSNCFIATAAYGSALAPEVVILQRYREAKLRQSYLGCWLIYIYEQCSPPFAELIAGHPLIRIWVQRLFLAPLVWIVHQWLD